MEYIESKENMFKRFALNAFLVLAVWTFNQGQTELKAQTIDTLMTQTPTIKGDKDIDKLEAQKHYYEGRLQMAHKDYAKALELYLRSDSLWANNASTLHSIAKCYQALDKENSALDYYEKAYRLDSTDRDFASSLIEAYVSAHQREEAILLTKNWLKRQPEDLDFASYLSRLYYMEGNFEEVLPILDELQEKNRNDFLKYRGFAAIKLKVFFQQKDFDKAEPELLRVIKAFPNESEEMKITLLEVLLSYGQPEKVLVYLNEYEQSNSLPEVELLEKRYLALAGLGRDKEALSVLDKFLESPEGELNHKIDFLKKDLTKEAERNNKNYIKRWQLLLEQYPNDSKVRFAYAETLRLQKRFREAIDCLLPLKESEAENKELWSSLIGDAISLEDTELVGDFCLQAIKTIKDDWRNYFYASISLYTKGEKKEAKAIVEQGIKDLESLDYKESAGLSMLYGQLGDFYGEFNNDKEQLKAYDKALELNENNTLVLNNYAYHLSKEEERLDDAERMAAQGVRLNPENANLLETYAWILYQKKSYALAGLYMKKAIEAGKKSKDISAIYYEHFGYIHQAQGEVGEAKACFDEALKLYEVELLANKDKKSKRKEIKRAIRGIKKALKKLNNK